MRKKRRNASTSESQRSSSDSQELLRKKIAQTCQSLSDVLNLLNDNETKIRHFRRIGKQEQISSALNIFRRLLRQDFLKDNNFHLLETLDKELEGMASDISEELLSILNKEQTQLVSLEKILTQFRRLVKQISTEKTYYTRLIDLQKKLKKMQQLLEDKRDVESKRVAGIKPQIVKILAILKRAGFFQRTF